MGRTAIRLAVGLAVAALAAAGCSQARASGHDHGAVSVVATTDVWGSVASAVAGRARVGQVDRDRRHPPTRTRSKPPRRCRGDRRRVAGGLQRRRLRPLGGRRAGRPPRDRRRRRLLTARHSRSRANEHVFYDLGIAKAVADEIAKRLAEIDSAHADEYRANATEFGKQADDIAASERAIGKAHPSGSVVATEPVALLPAAQRRYHRPHPGRLRQRGGGGRRPVTRRRRRDARPDQHPPGVGAAVQPADRDRGHQTDPGRRAARVASGRHGHRNPARRVSTI